MLFTGTRFFWAEVVERSGYLYTLFPGLHYYGVSKGHFSRELPISVIDIGNWFTDIGR